MAKAQLNANITNDSRLVLGDVTAVIVTSIASSTLPWIVCIVGLLNGQNAAAILGGAAGVAIAGASIIRAIRGSAKNPDDGTNDSEVPRNLKNSKESKNSKKV